MKKLITKPLFLTFTGIYLILFGLKKAGIYIPIVSDHLADLLAVPVILSIALLGIRLSGPERADYKLSIGELLIGVGLISFFFEGLFPLLSDRHTADPLDLVAYAIGAFIFWRWMNHDVKKSSLASSE